MSIKVNIENIEKCRKAILNDPLIEVLMAGKIKILEAAPVKYVFDGFDLTRVFDDKIEKALSKFDVEINNRMEEVKIKSNFYGDLYVESKDIIHSKDFEEKLKLVDKIQNKNL